MTDGRYRRRPVLAAQHRMRTPVLFSATTRSGVRSGRRNVVLYARGAEPEAPTLVGFIVSKAVGNAVVRNRTKRRLRELAAQTVASHPTGLHLVVRALPSAAEADWQKISRDYRSAVSAVLRKTSSSSSGPASSPPEDAPEDSPESAR